jgi:hypothetical protein
MLKAALVPIAALQHLLRDHSSVLPRLFITGRFLGILPQWHDIILISQCAGGRRFPTQRAMISVAPEAYSDSGRLVGPLLLWMDLKLRGQVSTFDQTATAKGGSVTVGTCWGTHEGCAMSQTDDFWQYAKEAIISATCAETEEDRHGLLDLARTWTQAALVVRASFAGRDSQADQLISDLGLFRRRKMLMN